MQPEPQKSTFSFFSSSNSNHESNAKERREGAEKALNGKLVIVLLILNFSLLFGFFQFGGQIFINDVR